MSDLYGIPGLQDYPVFGRIRDQAPGFTLANLDSLLRDAYTAGFEAGVNDIRPEVSAAQGHLVAFRDNTEKVVRSYLNHIERRLRERSSAPKTTIAIERDFMRSQAVELGQAITKLEESGATWSAR